MILTPAQLVSVTKKVRPKAQARVLRELGVPFKPRPDGTLLVSQASVEAFISGKPAANDADAPGVDVNAIKEWGRGKTARASRSS